MLYDNNYYIAVIFRNIINAYYKGWSIFMDILDKITKLREKRHWTEYKLAEKSELPQSTISSWYSKNMTPSIASLEKICKAFGITMSQFFTDSSSCVELTEEQREMLEKWNALNDKQKKALLQFLANN